MASWKANSCVSERRMCFRGTDSEAWGGAKTGRSKDLLVCVCMDGPSGLSRFVVW